MKVALYIFYIIIMSFTLCFCCAFRAHAYPNIDEVSDERLPGHSSPRTIPTLSITLRTVPGQFQIFWWGSCLRGNIREWELSGEFVQGDRPGGNIVGGCSNTGKKNGLPLKSEI